MATCMLCSTSVADGEVVCPHCGGATDATRIDDRTAADLASPWAGTPPTGPPEAAPSWEAPPALPSGPVGPPPGGWGGPAPSPPAWAPPSGPPGGYGGPGYGGPGYGGPAYGPPGGHGGPGYGGPGYGAPGYGVPYAGGWVPPVPTNGMAVTSLVVSIAALVTAAFCGVTILAAPVGAVLGHLAMRRISETGEKGRGLALAGVIVGWIGTALLLLGIAVLVAVLAAA